MEGGDRTKGSSSSEFRTFLADDWVAWMAASPETATSVGTPGFDDRWTDDSPDGIARRTALLHRSLERTRGFSPDRLPRSDRLSYELYRETLEAALTGLEFGDDPAILRNVVPRNLWMPINQMDGVHISAVSTLDLQRREQPAEVERLVRRLERLPVAVEQNVALLRAGLARGYSPPRVAVRGLLAQVEALLTDDPLRSALLRPFATLGTGVPAAARTEYVARARSLVSARVVPAFRSLHEYLAKEYVPACRETIAATALPRGADGYAYHVRWQTTTRLSPQEIHAVGLAEVARIEAQMAEVARRTGFSGSLAEFHRFLKSDPRFYHASVDDLVNGYRALAKRIDPQLARVFGRLPRLPYGVEPVPEYRAPSSPAAYYLPGAPSAGRAGIFYANTYALAARPRWEMEALALHESVPGHHLQFALGQEAEDVPEFRKHTGYGAFVEGWGLYAESLGEEVGLYTDPYSKFGQLTFDMWRSIRLVVDTGMHALGWTREQAIDFFRAHTGKSDLEVGVEVDRYLVWPGQSLGYKIGQLKIRELRTAAERRLGARFDLRGFHDAVLADGAVPLDVLERRVTEWVEARAGAPP